MERAPVCPFPSSLCMKMCLPYLLFCLASLTFCKSKVKKTSQVSL